MTAIRKTTGATHDLKKLQNKGGEALGLTLPLNGFLCGLSKKELPLIEGLSCKEYPQGLNRKVQAMVTDLGI